MAGADKRTTISANDHRCMRLPGGATYNGIRVYGRTTNVQVVDVWVRGLAGAEDGADTTDGWSRPRPEPQQPDVHFAAGLPAASQGKVSEMTKHAAVPNVNVALSSGRRSAS